MIENATAGLTLLAGDHEVVVTREDGHQELVARWAPGPDGLPRQVAVELVPAPITHGPHRGRPGIEIHLDGCRIGELTPLVAQRYGPLVDAHLRVGRRPAAVARVHRDRRGFQVESHLPWPDAVVAAEPEPVRAGRRRPRVPPATIGETAAPRGPGAPADGRRRTPWLVGVGVVGLLVAVGAGVGGGRGIADTATGTRAPAGVGTATSGPTTPSTVPSPTAAAPRTPSVGTAGVPARRTSTPARPSPAPVRGVPAPRTTAKPARPPRPTTRPARPGRAASTCSPRSSGCVPDAPVDVDCAGDGPSSDRGVGCR